MNFFKIALVSEAWGERTVFLDEEDYDRVASLRWCVTFNNGIFYAQRKENRWTSVLMHRFILGLKRGDGIIIDHINGNGLDNRKMNLRIANYRINALNSDRSRNARMIERHGRRFRLRPTINGVRTNIGSFASEEEALEALRRYRDEK